MFGFGRTVKVEASRGALLGDGEFAFNIAGESHYQKEIASIVGGKTREGHKGYCAAVLSREPTNPHDRRAVVVTILTGRSATSAAMTPMNLKEHLSALALLLLPAGSA